MEGRLSTTEVRFHRQSKYCGEKIFGHCSIHHSLKGGEKYKNRRKVKKKDALLTAKCGRGGEVMHKKGETKICVAICMYKCYIVGKGSK